MEKYDPLLNEIIKIKIQLRGMFLEHYAEHELFSWVWWLSVLSIVTTLFVWWKIVEKKRLLEICFFGLIVNIAAVFLDVSGSEFVLWEYPIHILPQLPLLLPVDFVIVPVVGMIIYQKFAKWGQFVLVCTISSALMAFIAEPLAVLVGLYKLITWRYIYSFPIYILIYVAAKYFTRFMLSKQRDAKSEPPRTSLRS